MGEPVPQGSLSFFKGRAVHTNHKYLHPWRNKIAEELRPRLLVSDGPVEVDLRFTIRRPRTVTRSDPTVRPDLDKLVRAVLDALTGVAYEDDSQVIRLSASKRYGLEPGVLIALRTPMEPEVE